METSGPAPPNARRQPNSGPASTPAGQSVPPARPAGRRRPRANGSNAAAAAQGNDASPSSLNTGGTRGRRRRGPQNPRAPPASDANGGHDAAGERADGGVEPKNGRGRGGRRGKFNPGLSTPTSAPSTLEPSRVGEGHRYGGGGGPDDLTSSLIRALSTAPYPDCPICFAALHPAQPTWSCSPSSSRDNVETAQCCWTTFHLKCIRSWAGKSVKELADAWRARGEDRPGEWRCPGCQAKRLIVPNGYRCFCGATPEPKPPRLATPHSCANPCSRPRPCGHPCPLACHPGPCPPCQVTTEMPCYCTKQVLAFKCAHLTHGKSGVESDLSCHRVCGRKLGCGNHSCTQVCHPGPCAPCDVTERAKCYCGKVERQVGCGDGEEKPCQISGQKWLGRFQCENECERCVPFDCGKHACKKPCHPPSISPPPCPRSPSVITHCPCGKHALLPSDSVYFPSGAILMRTSCSDPIPTCTSTCMKPLASCEHVCSAKCHTGACPPCTIMLVRPCRCGATSREVQCSEVNDAPETDEILCDRQCTALRSCGRHRCNRVCCPLASLASATKGKGKKRTVLDNAMDDTGLHACDLVCGKVLGCGNHHCEERDHKGPCPPCLRSSFEEMICYCGRTVLEPPIPCGTRINCTYPCSRPPPPCGHPSTQHSCHEDPAPCPPCPFLTSKTCACGKRSVPNVRCSQEKVSCGTVCGRLMACGFHRCEKLCHGDDCGTCTAPCGKARKLCLPAQHPCTLPCHAPGSCSEAEPCSSLITLTCPCGRIRQAVKCGRSTANPAGREATQQIRCSNECSVAKRNARLADALGISTQSREKAVTWDDELTAFARANVKFLSLVEKTFADFIASDRKTQVLPHMPPDRRKFVHDVAAVYRMDTQMVDQEPHRSVQLIRRIDTRIPVPPLSSCIPSFAGSSLGKLTDLRAPAGRGAPLSSAQPAPGGARGWTSVVTAPSRPASTGPSSSAPRLGNGRPSAPRVSAAPSPTPTPTPQDASRTAEGVPDDWEDDV
ncbi:hypothetical protein PLICRDRAFT_117694 [Plicaturopsis crispa FD-325 SS-3]|uniref:R3H domain-containing protein n=1 Tax=Plicaturopsis crispa FD-325 SS-3 TaxID=944288 RepID=A0A0C9T5M6_PLICR|nr:hypothetical protein PLICRDRAFT_117694 [Plicaturopsis crispa FD-325 SS-3]